MTRTLIACIPHTYTVNKGWQTRHALKAAQRLEQIHRLTAVMFGNRQILWAVTWASEQEFTFLHCHVISNCREDALNHLMDMMKSSGISFELLTDAPHNVVESTHA